MPISYICRSLLVRTEDSMKIQPTLARLRRVRRSDCVRDIGSEVMMKNKNPLLSNGEVRYA
jgi:hypothetical protein